FNYVQSRYGSYNEYLWRRYPNYAVFCHKDNLKWYDPEEFTFDRLKNEFDIFAVRGPRGIPQSLSNALNTDQPSYC
ncbi:MAG: hypothetical protein J6Z35_02990, partial [Lachnospiraceae bacterium]|nr:hypothetical protein [Lachnospiraceae bacterium]